MDTLGDSAYNFILTVYLYCHPLSEIGDNIFFKFILDIIMMNLRVTKIVKKKSDKAP